MLLGQLCPSLPSHRILFTTYMIHVLIDKLNLAKRLKDGPDV
jgi:hypothetical protein